MQFSPQALYNGYRRALRHPKYGIWVVIGTVVYLLSPIDLVPDFLLGFGQIDDALIVGILLTEVVQLVRERLAARSRQTSPDPDTVKGTSGKSGQTVDVDSKPL